MSSSQGWLVVAVLALLTGLGGVLFELAFRNHGQIQASAGGLVRWAFHPLIVLGLVLGIGARVASYVGLAHWNLSQVTLLSALGIVATLLLALALLGERLTPAQWAGSALIVAGAALVGR